MPKSKFSCYVIMPFSGTNNKRTENYWSDHYEIFLKPTIEYGNRIQVSKSVPIRGDLVNDIISKLITSDIVIADLTDHNPNVFWELGVRQSFAHGTITIAEHGTTLPFDISGKGILFYYHDDHIKNSQFAKNLKIALNDCIKSPANSDSRVLDAIGGRGSLYEAIHKEEIFRRIVGLITETGANRKIYTHILNFAKKNLENDRLVYAVRTLRLASLELLLTNRYLTADDNFYAFAEDYYDHLKSVNMIVSNWHDKSKSYNNWFVKYMDSERYVVKFIDNLKAIIKTLK